MRSLLRYTSHHLTKAVLRLILITSALLSASQAVALEQLTLQLKWKHQFQFAGYYAAQENGYYRDEGLDVRLIEGGPDNAPIEMLLSGHANYAVTDSGALLARASGKPVVVLAVIFQHAPGVLLTRGDTGIRTLADLQGKRIMLRQPPLSAEHRAMLDQAGVSYIQQTSSFDVEDLISKRTDAFNAYSTNEPFLMQQRGIPFKMFRPRDYGIDFYGDTLTTTEAELNKHPDRAAAFRRATIKGWEYALNHIPELVDLILQKYNTQQKSRAHLIYEAEATHALMPDIVPIGLSNPERWRNVADVFIQQGLMSTYVDWDKFIYQPPQKLGDYLRQYPLQIGAGLLTVLMLLAALFSLQIQLRQKLKLTEALSENAARLKVHQATLLELSKASLLVSADLSTALMPITEAAARTLDVARMSVWFYYDDNRGIVCQDLYIKEDDRHEQDAVLRGDDYPNYFEALAEERVVVADDAHTNPATREFSEAYLTPLNITSMLDAPIRRGGRTIGVICHEHTGPARRWTLDEQIFAGSIADMVALYMEKVERKQAENALLKLSEELEQRVKERTRELEESNHAKSQFLSSMSHELRTPLNAILGFGQLLEMEFIEASDDKAQEKIKHVMQAGHHLLDLINGLLDLSRIEAGHLDLSSEPISLHQAITECITQIDVGLAKKHHITLINQVDDQDLEIMTDRMRFKQVIINLLSNAVKYNNKGGTVTIKTEPVDNERLRIAITDTGNGITAADIEKLFDRFERLSAKNGTIEGTGIGLTVTKQLVEAMGGTLGVESTVGQGSTFMVDFPLSASIRPEVVSDAPPLKD